MSMVRGITSRAHPLWLAYILHRVSGLALALFLPLHFWVLAMAMTDPSRLDGFLALTEAGVPCNAIAAYHHDHIFVPEARASDAIAAIEALRADS